MKRAFYFGLVVLTMMSLSTSVRAQAQKLFPIIEGDKVGYIDQDGKVMIPPQFDPIWAGQRVYASSIDSYSPLLDFKEGLAVYRRGEKFGYIDEKGSIVIAAQFDRAEQFSEGLAVVSVGKKAGFINKSGQRAFANDFDYARGFSEGLAAVKTNDHFGFINHDGEFVIQPRFGEATDFHNGLANVADKPFKFSPPPHQQHYFIDKAGNLALNCEHICYENFDEGLSPVGSYGRSERFTLGFMDRSGKLVLKRKWDMARRFSGGLAAAAISQVGGYPTGFINAQGKWVIRPRFTGALDFSEGLAGVYADYTKFGYINSAGEVVIKTQYTAGGSFVAGRARVLKDGHWIYIDKSGTVIWKPREATASHKP